MKQSTKHKSMAITAPPCHFQAGRLDISWQSVYDVKSLKLPIKKGSDSLPTHFTAYKINEQSLFSYLNGLDGVPYNQRVISLPINNGAGCALFHLEPSGVMSPELQKKFPNIKSWKGLSKNDPNLQLRLDFDGKTIKAAIIQGENIELFSPWQDQQGINYYLLYKKKDAGYKHIPIKQY